MPTELAPLRLEPGVPVRGMRVVRQPSPAGSASFSATYLAPAGWGLDPPGFEGVARVVNHLVASGAGPWDRVELARRLDRLGATVGVETSPESAEVTAWGPADEWVPLMEILREIVLRPRFDPGDVARARRQLRERQMREQTYPAARAHAELLRAIFPDHHPYHRTGVGTPRSLARLARPALARFHRTHYGGDGALLVVTGPARLARVESEARRLFSRLDESSRAPVSVPRLPRGRRRRVEVDLPGNSQVEIRVGGPSVAASAPEYPAGFLANQVLGGRPLISRLFQNVREKGGLAYGASSRLETLRFGGWWTAGAGTGADRWRKVVPMLEREVGRLRTERIGRSELTTIRESAIGEIPLGIESTAEAHELAVDATYHDLAPDFWLTWPKRLRAISPGEIQRSAATVFDPNRSVTVVVGPLARP